MTNKIVKTIVPLQNQWPCVDPFLFCAYHLDDYPKGNGKMGPAPRLRGRNIGQDFAGVDGWNMYHGDPIPGFPQHPHRGFETVTIARKGLVDHFDSLGAKARFGQGDTQWITAGKGISHCEMFPLVHDDAKNPLDLFQIWLNLPKKNKLVDAHFAIFWNEQTPKLKFKDSAGKTTDVTVIAGELNGVKALPPPPNSWAADRESDLGIWTLKLEAGAEFTLPAAKASSNRVIYFFRGTNAKIAGSEIAANHAVQVDASVAVKILNGSTEAEILVLQGKPLGEPVAQQGPFVMNTQQELKEAFADYQRTQFGGWPWPDDAPVNAKEEMRFAKFPDGHVEQKETR